MPELEKRIGLLRLLLADVEGKQAQVSEMEAQYKGQLSRIVDFVIHREGDVGNALSLMAEVQSKLDEAAQTGTHLNMIHERAAVELDVLILTKRVSEARSQLAELESRQQELADRLSGLPVAGPERVAAADAGAGDQAEDFAKIQAEVDDVSHEITRLHDLITEASERAARTIQGGKVGT